MDLSKLSKTVGIKIVIDQGKVSIAELQNKLIKSILTNEELNLKQSNPISIPLKLNPEGHVRGHSFTRLLEEPQFILQFIAEATSVVFSLLFSGAEALP